MAAPVFNLSGIHRILLDRGNGHTVRVSFADAEGGLLRPALILRGFDMGTLYLQGGIYDSCDQVQVLDHNVDGAQLEFGRYVVRFLRRGETVGEHVADSLEQADKQPRQWTGPAQQSSEFGNVIGAGPAMERRSVSQRAGAPG